MGTRKVYGRTLINALAATRQVKIDRNFNYSDLKDHQKDFLVRTFFEICEDEHLFEALVGQSEFGPLDLAYRMGEDAYCKALHQNITLRSCDMSYDEIADLMQCEAIGNDECEKAAGMNLFDLFYSDAKRFYKVISEACNAYLEKTLYVQIDEALPAYLEEQRAIRQAIFDENAA